MRYFSYDGQVLPEGTKIIGPDNRSLRYGEGLFETMKFANGGIVLLEEHLDRMWHGLQLLGFQLSTHCTKTSIAADITQLLKKNSETRARVRLTAVGGEAGLYDAPNQRPHFIIQTWPLQEDSSGKLNDNGMQLCVYRNAVKACDAFSNIKHNNYLCYLMGARHAKENMCNDAVIVNQYARVCESTIANIFIVQGNSILTPSLSEGCVAGIMRQFLVNKLPAIGYPVTEGQITPDDLARADEVFLSNSIFDIRWVQAIDANELGNFHVQRIHNLLSQTKGNVFC